MKRMRRGYTLVESLVVIALTAVTFTVTTVTMHSLYRSERQVRDDLQGQHALDQLADQLRWDAHEALSAVTVGGADQRPPRGLTLMLASGRSIHYAVMPHYVERIVRHKEAIEHRDGFRVIVPDSYWSVDADRDRPLLALHLVHRGQPQMSARSSTVEQIIQAAVGVAVPPGKK